MYVYYYLFWRVAGVWAVVTKAGCLYFGEDLDDHLVLYVAVTGAH